ncbi:hypothetical protein D3C76_1810200 [compost metagenome]
MEKEHRSLPEQPNRFIVWFFAGAVRDHVVHYAEYEIGDHDDVIHHLWIHPDVPIVPGGGRLGGPL